MRIASRLRTTLACALLLAPALAGCKRDGSKSPVSDAAIAERLALASAIGREIHRRDMLAWWASDVAIPLIGPEYAASIRGWVLDSDEPSNVHFLVEIDGALLRLLTVGCPSGPGSCVVDQPSAPTELSAINLAQHRAVVTASAHPTFVPTSDRYNNVVIPFEGGFMVYLIAATLEPGVVMLGVHYGFLISPDGDRVVESRAFSKSAIVQPPPPVGEPTMVLVTHLLDETPTEMHVWAALNYGVAIGVSTPSGALWQVDPSGVITRIEQ